MERFLEENAQESPWTGLTVHARPAKSDTTTVARSVKYDQALKSTISKHQSPSERLALSLSALGVGSGTFDAFSANTKHSHPIPSLRGSGTMGPSTEKTTRLMGLVVSDDIGSMQALIIRHERVPAGAPQRPRISIRVITDSVFDAILDAFSKVSSTSRFGFFPAKNIYFLLSRPHIVRAFPGVIPQSHSFQTLSTYANHSLVSHSQILDRTKVLCSAHDLAEITSLTSIRQCTQGKESCGSSTATGSTYVSSCSSQSGGGAGRNRLSSHSGQSSNGLSDGAGGSWPPNPPSPPSANGRPKFACPLQKKSFDLCSYTGMGWLSMSGVM
jgi:hypothetical protein